MGAATDTEAAPQTMTVSAQCEFCHEIVKLSDVAGANEAETISDALDIHYIEGCRMLTSCEACDKIVEKTRKTTHMLNECEQRDKVKQCNNCKEAYVNPETH